MTQTPPELPVEPAQASFFNRLSVVWVIPLAALLIALGVAWQSYIDRGPLIEIAFSDASGITVGQTGLRYRDINVGLVEDVTFTEALDRVLVKVRLDKQVTDYVDSDARFWVVQPEVTTRGITGLDTVLSGVFIEGVWDAEPGGLERRFEGLDTPPLIQAGQDGTRIELRTNGDTGLLGNTPIVYRGVDVGLVGPTRITPDGSAAVAESVIFAPYDQLVTTSTRFWDTSGFTFSLGPSGAEIDFNSIASLVAGGVTFETIVSGGNPITDGAQFEVFVDESAAQNSVFNASEGETLFLTVVFDQNVAGLTKDAPVELGGLQIGTVTSLTGIVDTARFGDRRVRLQATLSIDPSSLGLPGTDNNDEVLEFLSSRVEAGMRARLTSASLLTGGLKVEIAMIPSLPPATLDLTAEPFPLFPSIESDIPDISATAEGVFNRINNLPIEELLASTIQLMENASALIQSEELARTPAEINGLLADVRGIVGSDPVQQLPDQLSDLIEEVQGVADDLRGITSGLEGAKAVNRLLAAVDAAARAADGVNAATAGVPPLIARLDAIGGQVQSLPLDDLIREATTVLATADDLIGAEATQNLPDELIGTLAELRNAVAAFGSDAAAERVLSSIEAVGDAARDIGTATEGVPALLAEVEQVAATANALPLEDLISALSDLTRSADAIVGTEGAQALPGALSRAVEQIRAVLRELQRGGAIENTNRTLASARAAADAIAQSTEALPQVVARLNAVLDQASATLGAYDGDSDLGREARSALRDVAAAAEAIDSLARALERRPNSLLIGR
ncbi:MAG: MlaD family protein [Pseudomonadota bacterium]